MALLTLILATVLFKHFEIKWDITHWTGIALVTYCICYDIFHGRN